MQDKSYFLTAKIWIDPARSQVNKNLKDQIAFQ